MAEMGVFFEVNASSVDAELKRLDTLLSPHLLGAFIMGPIKEHLQENFSQFFADEGTPQSGPWVPLSEVTIEDRMSQGFGAGPINYRTGEMFDYVTKSTGKVTAAGESVVMIYPGRIPTGELGKKIRTAQRGGEFAGHMVPARPVMETGVTDLLWIMSALSFYVGAGLS